MFGCRKSSCVDSFPFQLILLNTPAESYSTGDNLIGALSQHLIDIVILIVIAKAI
jgi:hypothetical protein